MRNFKEVWRLLPPWLQARVTAEELTRWDELRLRVGRAPSLAKQNVEWPLPARSVTAEELTELLQAASRYSSFSVQEQLREGFLALPGGHRMGICGTAVLQNGRVQTLREISSVCIRFAREVPLRIEPLAPALRRSCLILGAPGWGKTTLLRACIRYLSGHGARVCVVDERREIAGTAFAQAQFDLGPCTDVLSGCPKSTGVWMLLRGMGPDWIALDEITAPEDLEAIREAGGCGVRLLATAHAAGTAELQKRALYRRLLELEVFENAIVLDAHRNYSWEGLRECSN